MDTTPLVICVMPARDDRRALAGTIGLRRFLDRDVAVRVPGDVEDDARDAVVVAASPAGRSLGASGHAGAQ